MNHAYQKDHGGQVFVKCPHCEEEVIASAYTAGIHSQGCVECGKHFEYANETTLYVELDRTINDGLLQGPFQLKMEVFLINKKNGEVTTAEHTLGIMKMPTKERIQQLIDDSPALANNKRLRPMTKRECISLLTTGSVIPEEEVILKSEDWDDWSI